ncbi:MAG TPA: hypothetical protein VHD63_07040 [Ktedonobacteraceae bacterium]|nr:hypothetical protein [Ktedonobacteraceae bacterium]
MREDDGKPLLSMPIREIEMDRMEQRYVTRVLWYLEHELHCSITYLSERGMYLIRFPEGTLEETYRGQSTQWTRRTTIRFPGGTTLQKYVSAPLNPRQRGQTMLAIPHRVLDGPEPPHEVCRQQAALSSEQATRQMI